MTVKISALTTIDVLAIGDLLPVVDVSSGLTKNATGQQVLDFVHKPPDNTFRITGSADITKQLAFEVDGLTASTTRTLTIPDRNLSLTAITLATPQASTSGTFIDFTSIPAGVKRITVMFNTVSTNGISHHLIQIGDSGGIEATGYSSDGWTPSGGITSYTTGFGYPSDLASNSITGAVTLTLENASTNTWCCAGLLRLAIGAAVEMTGIKALSAVLDRVRITTVNGTDAFDAGEINISYE